MRSIENITRDIAHVSATLSHEARNVRWYGRKVGKLRGLIKHSDKKRAEALAGKYRKNAEKLHRAVDAYTSYLTIIQDELKEMHEASK